MAELLSMALDRYYHSSRWQLEEIYDILLKMRDLASEQVRAPVPSSNDFGTSTTV
jgi:hypothetical protein